MSKDRKDHWEKVFESKSPEQVSWTQALPQTSLNLIKSLHLDKDAQIIDIGAGDSKLVDKLIEAGYQNISVLDISARALEKAQDRLGSQAQKVCWIHSDVLDFKPDRVYDLWHDRACFHFLSQTEDIEKYKSLLKNFVNPHLILATFSEEGPKKCSGLEIQQYSESSLYASLKDDFEKVHCLKEDHRTPFDTMQNFLFCHFKKK